VENIWASKTEEATTRWKKHLMRGSIIFAFNQILLLFKLKKIRWAGPTVQMAR
jgi:hypothetical protein